MATCTAPACVAAGLPSLAPSPKLPLPTSQVSFLGLRSSSRLDSLSTSPSSSASFALRTLSSRSLARTRCDALSTPIIISLSTGALLFLGRFVFLPFHRAQLTKAGLPCQNGISHFEAGDTRAAEVSSLLKTNDPAGFTIVDVLGWGALGHAVGYFILACASNGYDPQF